MRARTAVAGLALAACAAPGLALAQPAAPRTGPEAAPPPPPAYATPAPQAAPAPPASAPAAPPAADSGLMAEIRITADPGGPALPPRGWRPPEEPGVKLDHRPGERLDVAWVGRQFEQNGLGGARSPVDRSLALVQVINRAYLSAGFVNSGLVVAPGSTPGVLDLKILHGRLVPPTEGGQPFTVQWAEGRSKGLDAAYVRDRMPAALARPLNAVALEREFRLLAEDPAVRTVNADLRPGARPGEASLAVSVLPQDRFDLYLTGANSRSPSVGGERAAVGGSVRNLLRPGDLLSGEAGITDGLKDVAGSYALPFISPRNTLHIRGALNDSAVVDRPLVPLDIEARDKAFEIGVTRRFLEQPLLPAAGGGWSPAQTLSGGVTVARRISRTYLLGQPFSFSPGSVDGRSEYTAVRLVGDYVARNVDQVFAVSLTASLGVDGTRSNTPGILSPKQNFKVALAQVNYARRLSEAGLELRARVSGQIADSVLYSGERFSAGGEATVRGYRENLLLADNGVLGSVELAHPVNLGGQRAAGRGGFEWGAFNASVFADGAYLRNDRPPHPREAIYSVGASLAWTPSDAIFARITYGHALNKIPQAGAKDLQDRGVHFRVTVYPGRVLQGL